MLKKIKRLLGWATGRGRARGEDAYARVHEEYEEMRIRLAREIRECDERRLSYDRRTMHKGGAV